MTGRKYSLEAFFRKDPRKARMVIAAVCIGITALVAILCLTFAGGDETATETASRETVLDSWPDTPLLEDIPCPEDGTFLSARQTESTVAVFFGDFPSTALAEFLESTGLEFVGTAPYVAYDDGRTIAVEYDAKAGKLSVTVIKD